MFTLFSSVYCHYYYFANLRLGQLCSLGSHLLRMEYGTKRDGIIIYDITESEKEKQECIIWICLWSKQGHESTYMALLPGVFFFSPSSFLSHNTLFIRCNRPRKESTKREELMWKIVGCNRYCNRFPQRYPVHDAAISPRP